MITRLLSALLFLYFSVVNSFANSTAGAWSSVMQWPHVPIHASLLPTGEVLTWTGNGDVPMVIWNPATDQFTDVPGPGFNTFCAGHTFLPDGRLFVAGGNEAMDPGENLNGVKDASIFDTWTGTWTKIPDMAHLRWYPTTTTLSTGDILVISGRSNATDDTYATVPEVYNWKSNIWRQLTYADKELPVYPHMYQAPNGRAFYAVPASYSYYLDVKNMGSWIRLTTTRTQWRDIATGAMYDDGKIIVIGGVNNSNTVQRTAEIINLKSWYPRWQYTGSMACPRAHLNSTVLPDGKVLVTGGIRVYSFNSVPLQDVCYSAEMWNPSSGTFTTMASMNDPRWYHSVALLLPDGRVLSAGGNDYQTAEIYSPPYLFKGARPTIQTAPAQVLYSQKFVIQTSSPSQITKVAWIALGSVTHSFDQSQRYLSLAFSRTTTGLSISAPTSRNSAPPGYYMLFILNSSGVPSEAKIIQLL